MPNFNKVILAGNLTRDPDVRYSQKGAAVANLGVALNRKWKSESGEAKEEVTFVDIEAFGRQAETIAQYFKKGQPILVEGRLKLSQWTERSASGPGESGNQRSKLKVVLESFSFMDPPSGQRSPSPTSAAPPASPLGVPPSPPRAPAGPPPPDDDVPF